MTGKDHTLIARVLKHAKERGENTNRIVEYFALVLSQDNPRFKPTTFRRSCGLPEDELYGGA